MKLHIETVQEEQDRRKRAEEQAAEAIERMNQDLAWKIRKDELTFEEEESGRIEIYVVGRCDPKTGEYQCFDIRLDSPANHPDIHNNYKYHSDDVPFDKATKTLSVSPQQVRYIMDSAKWQLLYEHREDLFNENEIKDVTDGHLLQMLNDAAPDNTYKEVLLEFYKRLNPGAFYTFKP